MLNIGVTLLSSQGHGCETFLLFFFVCALILWFLWNLYTILHITGAHRKWRCPRYPSPHHYTFLCSSCWCKTQSSNWGTFEKHGKAIMPQHTRPQKTANKPRTQLYTMASTALHNITVCPKIRKKCMQVPDKVSFEATLTKIISTCLGM